MHHDLADGFDRFVTSLVRHLRKSKINQRYGIVTITQVVAVLLCTLEGFARNRPRPSMQEVTSAERATEAKQRKGRANGIVVGSTRSRESIAKETHDRAARHSLPVVVVVATAADRPRGSRTIPVV